MRRTLLFMLGMLLISAQLLAQNRTVTGKITDDKGNAVPNASVIIKGTNLGTTTGADGTFSLSVPANSRSLIVSFVGMGEKEITLGTGNNYDVSLSTQSKNDLQEIVVVGYGTQKRADLTGVVTTVKAKDIENKPFTSVDKALQGQVAGLQSVAASGQPGSSQAIIIRGLSSITASTAPLWVISFSPIPTNETIRDLEFAGTDKLKVPSAPVVVPRLVPLIITEAFGTAFPLSSVILPVTVRFCARSCALMSSMPSMKSSVLLMCF